VPNAGQVELQLFVALFSLDFDLIVEQKCPIP